jgi:hypothetical protein
LALGSDSQGPLVTVNNILPKETNLKLKLKLRIEAKTKFTTGFSSGTHITGNLAQTEVGAMSNNRGWNLHTKSNPRPNPKA